MLGNRIIYPSNKTSVDVNIANNDSTPYVIQNWLDSGDENSTPQTGKAPFIVAPAIFKIEPHSGQTTRIVFTGDPKLLPQDRESVFYFNFLQIPPTSAHSEEEVKNTNQLVILVKNRVKLFFRPADLPSPVNHIKKLGISIQKQSDISGYRVQIDNNNPWYASIVNIKIEQDKKNLAAKQGNMIAPFSRETWLFPKEKLNDAEPVNVTVSMMNDQGGVISYTYPVSF